MHQANGIPGCGANTCILRSHNPSIYQATMLPKIIAGTTKEREARGGGESVNVCWWKALTFWSHIFETFGISKHPLRHHTGDYRTWIEAKSGRWCRVSVLRHQHVALCSSSCARERRKMWASPCPKAPARKLRALRSKSSKGSFFSTLLLGSWD